MRIIKNESDYKNKFGDTNTVFRLNLYDDENLVDTTNKSLKLNIANDKGLVLSKNITTDYSGYIAFDFSDESIQKLTPDNYLLEIELPIDGQIAKYPTAGGLGFVVTKSLNETTGELVNTITFDEVLKSVDDKIAVYMETVKKEIKEIKATKATKGDIGTDKNAIHVEKFGNIDDFLPKEKETFILNLNNEFSDRGINVKWFGAKGDGVTDDTKAIQKAIDSALDLTLNGHLTKQYDIIIPAGWYAVSGLVMSPLVKLKPIGTVIFYGNDDTRSVLTIKPGNSNLEKGYVSNFPSQQYMNSSLINGGNGSIYIKGKSVRGSFKGTGLTLGGDESYGDTNPISRYNIDGLAISNFDTLVKIKTNDNYIGSFTNCHIEGGNIGVQFGNRENNVNVNSGENFGFYQCVIASCDDVAIDQNTMADVNLHGCSLDFNATAIKLNSGISNVNIIGGHIEHNYVVAQSYYKKTEWAYNQPKLTIYGTVLLNPSADPIFKGIMYLAAKDLNVSMQVEPKGKYGAMVDYDVNVIGSGGITFTNGYFSNLTRTTNQMYNSGFVYKDDGYSVKKDTEKDLYEYRSGDMPGSPDFANGVHMVPTVGNVMLIGSDIDVQAGEAYTVGISKYLLDNANGSISFSIFCFDSKGKKIDEINNAVDIKRFTAKEWKWVYSGQMILPTGTAKAHFKIYFTGPMDIYVNQTYFGKS